MRLQLLNGYVQYFEYNSICEHVILLKMGLLNVCVICLENHIIIIKDPLVITFWPYMIFFLNQNSQVTIS